MSPSLVPCTGRLGQIKTIFWASVVLTIISLLAFKLEFSERQLIQVHVLPEKTQQLKNNNTQLVTDDVTDAYVTWNKANGLTPNGFLSVVGDEHIYIYSVVANNSSMDAVWDIFLVNGWEPKTYSKMYACCFRYHDGETLRRPFLQKRFPPYRGSPLEARQYVCGNPYNSGRTAETLPAGVTIVPNDTTCPGHVSNYVSPAFPAKQADSKMVVCAKWAYGKKNSEQLVEWMEYQLLFGVDKIFMYPCKDLIKESLRVLQHYQNNGLVELLPIKDLPEMKKHHRYWSVQSRMLNNDAQVIIFDAQARMSGFRYASIFDTDEFIVLTDGSKTYQEFLENQLRKHPEAGAFRFMDKVHIVDWEKSDPDSDLFIQQYGLHTEAFWDAPKNMYFPDRVVPGSVGVHALNPNNNYKRVSVAPSDGTLHHYRHCRGRWLVGARQNNTLCYHRFQRLPGTKMKASVKKIEENIRKVRLKLKLTV